MSRVSYLLLAITVAVVVALLAAPAFSVSTNQCNVCHGTKYSQTLDIVEGNTQNKIPTSLQVGQTQTVTIAVSNINNAALNNQLSSVSVKLSSQNGHFSVGTPTFNVGTLSTGTATATWQITGVSQGSDALLISSSATNTHNNLKFSDSYSPSPALTVGATATSTPAPMPSPTVLPTATPTIAPTQVPTSGPTATPGPNPTTTSPPPNTPTLPPTTNSPTPTQSGSPTPTTQPSTTSLTNNPTQDPTSTPQPNPTDTGNSSQATSTPTSPNQPLQGQPIQEVGTSASVTVSSTGTMTIVAPAGTHISWETSNQELNLGGIQPLTLNLQYSTTDGTNPLSVNTLALNWAAVGGIAPLKISIDYQSFDGTWTTIGQNILGDGSYTWTLPDTEMNVVKMKIRVSDSSGASQTISATADINVSHMPKYSAMSPLIPYFQVLDLSAALVAMAFYVRKMKTKRASIPFMKSTIRGA